MTKKYTTHMFSPLQAMGKTSKMLVLMLTMILSSWQMLAQTVVIGAGALTGSTGSNIGPIYRSSASSAFDFSKHYYLYTAAELNAAGIFAGSQITSIAWNKANALGTAATNNVSIWRVYMKNTATAPSAGWSNSNFATQSTGATLVYNNTAQVIPLSAGYITLTFGSPFTYTGGSLEIGSDWDCSLFVGSPTTGGFTWKQDNLTNQTFGGSASTATITMALQTVRPQIQITYSAGSPCVGLPTPGNTVSSSNPVCPSAPFTLSLQNSTLGSGVSYQWQSSPDNVTYTNITGAINGSYTATQTVATYYRCNVTCVGTATSNPVQVTMNSFLGCYCASAATLAADEEIYSITVNGASTPAIYAGAAPNGCTTVAPGPGSILNRYSNFTTLGNLTSIAQGQTVNFTVAENECDGATFYAFGTAIWIDYNQDGILSDATEKVFVENATLIGPRNVNGAFTVPITATTGQTLMRVTIVEGGSGAGLTSCLSYNYGETEDWYVNIIASTNCTGMPAPGNTQTSSASLCSGSSVTLSLQSPPSTTNISYQWQSSPDGIIPYTNISGETNPTYTTNITSSAYYQCVVTCLTTSQAATSTPIQVNVVQCINLTASGSTTTCGANFYDSGGPAGSYLSSENYTYTFNSPTPGSSWITMTSNSIQTESGWDYITIHNGPTTASPIVYGPLSGAQTINFTSTDPTGALTFVFTSDASVTNPGWDITISCFTPPPCSTTPNPGNTISSLGATVCTGQNFTLSLQNSPPDLGQSWQWQSSPDGITYTNISGATNATHIANQITDTYYQCIVTCAGNGSTTSNPVFLTQAVCFCSIPLYSLNGTAGSHCGVFDYIDNVTFAGINNTSGCNATPDYYQYFNSLTANVQQTVTYPVSISTPAGGASFQLFKVYIDFNDNGSFDDAGETVYTSGFINTAVNSTSGNISISASAPLGTHRMRVRSTNPLNSNIDANSCSEDGYYGEVEDYNITITAAPACSGTPAPGQTLASTPLACAATSINLSLQNSTSGTGVTYQWQYATDLAFTSPVNMGTAATQTTTQPITYYYRCEVTCAGNTGTSTPVLVTSTTVCYCTNPLTGSNGCGLGLYINNVTFGSINNTSGCYTPVPYTTPYYEYFASSSTTVTQGISYPINISTPTNPGSYYNAIGVWIDYNDNGSFEDAGELVLATPTFASTLTNNLVGNILIPLSAPIGNHLMRVRCGNVDGSATILNSCTVNSVSGETEDYNITIVAPAVCAGTPSAGNTLSTANPACSSASITLSMSVTQVDAGITYQWQSSPDGISYGNISGATNATYTTTQSVATYYQCVVSCTPSGLSATSTPLQVTQNLFYSCYTPSIPSLTADEEIYSVSLNGNQVTPAAYAGLNGCATAAPGAGSLLSRYSNFIPIGSVGSFSQNVPFTFNVQEDECDGATFYAFGTAIWIDYNQDGVFDDNTEKVFVENATATGPRNVTGSITPPPTALSGVTAMRIIVAEGFSGTGLTSSMTYNYGETEDFLITIGNPNCIANPTSPTNGGTGCASVTGTILTWPAFPGATQYDVYFGTTDPATTLVSDDQSALSFNAGVLSTTSTYYWSVVPQIPGATICNTWSFTVNPTPVPAVNPTSACEGTPLSLTANNSDITQTTIGYAWTTNAANGFTASTQSPSVTASASIAQDAGTYVVVITNSFLCTASANVAVTVDPNPVPTIASQVTVECPGQCNGQVDVNATGGTVALDYLFDFNTIPTIDGIYNTLCVGPSLITVSDDLGCVGSITVTLVGSISNVPAASVVVPPINNLPAFACNGTLINNINVPTVATATYYLWDGPTGTTFNGGNPSPYNSATPNADITFGSLPGSASGYYIGVQAANGCGTSLRKVQWVRGILSVPTVTGPTVLCGGGSGSYSITNPAAMVGAQSYTWTGPAGSTIDGNPSPYTTTSTAAVTLVVPGGFTSGTMCVVANAGCISTAPKCISISTTPAVLGQLSGNFTVCPPATEVYTVSNPGAVGGTYNWILPANTTGSTTTLTPTNTLNILAGFTGGDLKVTYTNTCGVTSTLRSKSIGIGLPTVPASITALVTNGLCGQLASFGCPGQGGATFNWTFPTGSTPASITAGNNNVNSTMPSSGFTSGSVCVTATNGCGTSTARCITVKGTPLTPGAITIASGTLCAPSAGPVGFTSSLSGLTGVYTLNWVVLPATAATTFSGQGTNNYAADWNTAGAATVNLTAANACGSTTRTLAVNVSGCVRLAGEATAPIAAPTVNVYPNPATELITITYGATQTETVQLQLKDVSGRVVMNSSLNAQEGENQSQMDVSTLAKGVYLLEVNAATAKQQVRVVVQ